MTLLCRLLLPLLLAVLLPGMALAQNRSFTPACRAQCNPTSSNLADNAPAIQACLIRCQAGSDFTRGTNAAPRRVASAPATPATTGTWAVIYAAPLPHAALGVSQDQADRNLAHMNAQRSCDEARLGNCRVLAEAGPGQCLAAVHAGQVFGLFRTADRRTFQVTLVEYGKGATQAEADRTALGACNGRGNCEIVARACGRP